MQPPVIGILGTGDMGSAVGAVLRRAGFRVVTSLEGRSRASRALATDTGLEDLGSLDAVLASADIFLSILPPAVAFDFARDVSARVKATGRDIVYADCNAVAPATVEAIGALFSSGPASFVDVGIVGPAPKAGTGAPTRFYVSGPARAPVLALDVPDIVCIDMGESIGRASAIKMCYAAMNKGVDALLTTVLLAAERLGVRAELMDEFEASQPQMAARMRKRIPYLAAAAGRFTGEMREIARTFDTAGVSGDIHRGAEWLYARLAESALGQETRATLPEHRSLDDALAAFVAALVADD